ncbi:MAG: hypothetical protein ACKPE3_02525, partial [Sphaerospermopsis kisseleviana]
MILNKNQIEAVRYQVRKLNNSTCTNDEIRDTANKFKEFDAVLIANDVVNSRKLSTISQNEELTTAIELKNEDSMLSLLDQENKLTTTQKQELVKLKSVELGIDLADTDIIKIADMVSAQINDTVDFLNEVTAIIQQFFINRNNQVKSLIDQKINNISTIINTGNEQLGDIFNSANKQLIDIANECGKQSTDYKSTYKTKLES